MVPLKKKWFVIEKGSRKGPYSDSELKELARKGEVAAHTQVLKEGISKPIIAGRIRGLFAQHRDESPKQAKPTRDGSKKSQYVHLVYGAAISGLLLLLVASFYSKAGTYPKRLEMQASSRDSKTSSGEVFAEYLETGTMPKKTVDELRETLYGDLSDGWKIFMLRDDMNRFSKKDASYLQKMIDDSEKSETKSGLGFELSFESDDRNSKREFTSEPSAENFLAVKEGWYKQKVVDRMGDDFVYPGLYPPSNSQYVTLEQLQWENEESRYTVSFRNGKVVGKMELPKRR